MAADLIVTNGRLITFDPSQPFAEAMALTGGRIAAVGSKRDMDSLRGPATRVIDARKGTVLPGFVDSHIHLFGGGVELGQLNVAGIRSEEKLTTLVRAWASRNPDDAMLMAVCAEYGALGDLPIDRRGLDRVLPDRPFALFGMDHHTAWANTRALELAGILNGGAVPEGSEIAMGDDGKATGLLLEAGAFHYLLALMPSGGREWLGMTTGKSPDKPPTPAQRKADKAALLAGLNHLARHGITTYHNMDGNFYQLELLQELLDEGHHLVRGEVPFHLKNTDPVHRLDEAADMRRRYSSDWLWSRRLKLFVDGVIDSGTAFMLDPYPNWPDSTGAPLFEQSHFDEICIRADRMGLQISVHACGDAGIRRTLDAFAAAQRANGKRDSRHRIEHVETLHPDDLPRFAELGVVASMQPRHSPRSGLFSEPPPGQLLHEHQKLMAYPWKTLRDSGVRMIFSTDWPVVPIDVMPNIRGAVAPVDLGPAWGDQRQSLMDTLASYSCDGAWAEFNEDRKGSLKAGMMADVVIMSHDLEGMPLDRLDQAAPVTTICDGKVTYEA